MRVPEEQLDAGHAHQAWPASFDAPVYVAVRCERKTDQRPSSDEKTHVRRANGHAKWTLGSSGITLYRYPREEFCRLWYPW
jgi:hypothetical protein